MTLNKIIEKLRELKFDLDSAFDEGKIDLDRISAGLEEAAADLELLGKAPVADKSTVRNKPPSGSLPIAALKSQTVDVTDYR